MLLQTPLLFHKDLKKKNKTNPEKRFSSRSTINVTLLLSYRDNTGNAQRCNTPMHIPDQVQAWGQLHPENAGNRYIWTWSPLGPTLLRVTRTAYNGGFQHNQDAPQVRMS